MTSDAIKLKNVIFNKVQAEIKSFKDIEDEGYRHDDIAPFCTGIAYWFYSETGISEIVPMHDNKLPVYPEGDWHFVAMTVDGVLEYDNSFMVALILCDQENKFELEELE